MKEPFGRHIGLILCTALASMLLSGCLSGGCGTPPPLEVMLTNASGAPVDVNVTATTEVNATIFSRTFSLAANGTASTGAIASAQGTYQVTVRVDANRTATRPIVVGPCTFGASATIWADRVDLAQIVS